MITVSPHATDQDKYIIWLKQAESFYSAAGLDYIDVLVDQAGTDQPLQNDMLHLSPAIHWYALFEVKWFTEFGHLNRGDMLTS
ncbi:hypothetical protein Q0S96_21110, partial [Escherichia coli OX25:H28]